MRFPLPGRIANLGMVEGEVREQHRVIQLDPIAVVQQPVRLCRETGVLVKLPCPALSVQQRTTLGESMPRVALRESTTSCDSSTIRR